jgi:hypothetical protein
MLEQGMLERICLSEKRTNCFVLFVFFLNIYFEKYSNICG